MVPDMRHTAVSIPIMSITFITTMESAMLFLLITAMLPKENLWLSRLQRKPKAL